MKKYNVESVEVTAAMIKGEEPWNNISMNQYGDYVEAETPEEAIEQLMDWLVEDNGAAEINEAGDMVIYRDEDGEITGGEAFFKATEATCEVTYQWEKGGEWSDYFTFNTEEEARQDVEETKKEYKPYAYRILDITGDIVAEGWDL